MPGVCAGLLTVLTDPLSSSETDRSSDGAKFEPKDKVCSIGGRILLPGRGGNGLFGIRGVGGAWAIIELSGGRTVTISVSLSAGDADA